jgi:hypothetical protein
MSGTGELSIQLSSLRDFAAALNSQALALQGHKNELDGLGPASGGTAIFGDFPEAGSLAQVHLKALQHVRQLTEQVEGLVWFAEKVASEAAAGYQNGDASSVSTLGEFTINDSTEVGRLV